MGPSKGFGLNEQSHHIIEKNKYGLINTVQQRSQISLSYLIFITTNESKITYGFLEELVAEGDSNFDSLWYLNQVKTTKKQL